MARVCGAIAVGTLLWGMWALLWRGADWPILAWGAIFPAIVLAASATRRVSLSFPASAWLRWDLWLLFFVLTGVRVMAAVASTSVCILTGRTRPGIVAVPVQVRSEIGQLLLLWSITVTPGTIALLVEDSLYVHALHLPSNPGPKLTLPGLSTVEWVLKRLWG